MPIKDLLPKGITEETLRGMELKRNLTTSDKGRFSVLEYCEEGYTFVVGCPPLLKMLKQKQIFLQEEVVR